MHRLATIPGVPDPDGDTLAYVEQQPAPLVFLSSADSDLRAIAHLMVREPALVATPLRLLNLAALVHPAVIDHYVASSLGQARLVVVRLLGGRGHWSYGLERLAAWSQALPGRTLLVLAGTREEDRALAELGNGDPSLSLALAACLREGGEANLRQVLRCFDPLLAGTACPLPQPQAGPDPLPEDWRQEAGARVGVILYRAQLQAGDTALMGAVLAALRQRGLAPRALWLSSLRDPGVQAQVAQLYHQEGVEAVLCGTGFASVRLEEAGLGAPLWEQLGVPVLQMLCSGRPRQAWNTSSIGLGPLDLSLQVVLPELDGRITTRVAAFKEASAPAPSLGTALQQAVPDGERLAWIAELVENWIQLARTPAGERRVALVLANYPTRNSRLANGVGLDTPASTVLMLRWMAQAGYRLQGPAGPEGSRPQLPEQGDVLIQQLLAGRSNDPESGHRPPLDHLPLVEYEAWYGELPLAARERIEAVWGEPAGDEGLEASAEGTPAFAVRGLRFGQVVVVIQPERGYGRQPELRYHSPDLPPTHAYLAQYLWLRRRFACQVVVHVGKHGNLEWLPGKGVGLAATCFPEVALGPMPHLYPFIVNDPGEGSQAKRRSQAVILDHLTPPLGRAGLHGDLQALEALLDEYWEARELGAERCGALRAKLEAELKRLELPSQGAPGGGDPDGLLEAADGYLCELKEAQIRLGLHTYGTLPESGKLAELLLCLARPPQAGLPGITQALAQDLGLALDPWATPEEAPLSRGDQERLGFSGRHGGDAIARLEEWALELLRRELAGPERPEAGIAPGSQTSGTLTSGSMPSGSVPSGPPTGSSPPGAAASAVLAYVRQRLLPALLACDGAERAALLQGLAGGRIAAGPSGAPSRGRPDVLPTGRNFYSVDLRGLPTEAAWDLGRRSAELLLEDHLQSQGDDLRHLALSVWGTATMRNGGEDIGQALALLGVRPVWDGPSRRLVDLEVIPLGELGRPRVDVTLRISGLFRDAFPQLVSWFQRACGLVAALEEPEHANPLAAAARREGEIWRVYGSAPGAYGAGLQALIDSGQWETSDDLGEAFLAWSSWRYGPAGAGQGREGSSGDPALEGIEAQADRQGLERRLRQVQVVLHNQDNREHDLLDADDYYQFQGGLSAAVQRLRGQPPELWFGDHSRQQRPRLHRLEKELDKVLRSRLLNPRWIEGMAQHGYKGGFEMAASLDYLFAYDASTGRVPDWSYGALTDRWLRDGGVLAFLRSSNPWALRDMAERLLEAHHRGLWQGAEAGQIDHLKGLVLDTEARIEGMGGPPADGGPGQGLSR